MGPLACIVQTASGSQLTPRRVGGERHRLREDRGEVKYNMFEMIMAYIYSVREREEGQALVEYALIISLVALIAVGGLTFAGGRVSSMFSAIGSKLNVTP
jgi:pilus assembly protein Flp/PilA